jgi:hypothetical protein
MWGRVLSPIIFPLEGGGTITIRNAHNSLPSDGEGQDRTGQDRTGQDRTGQVRTGQDRTEGLNPHTNLLKMKLKSQTNVFSSS